MLSKFLPVTCLKVADLGCASGPNTFFSTYEIMDTITRICQKQHWESPELQVFLNDLPENDFNAVFRSVPALNERLKKDEGDLRGPCFIVGVPGSFYQRLFPSRSMHFVYSSSSLHWLSKAPRGDKGNIYMSKSSSADAFKAYSEQFRMDFLKFLRLRSEEMVGGGRMLHCLVGRSSTDPTSNDCCSIYELLNKSLFDLVAKGLVQESNVDSFNVPYYNPCEQEMREIIEEEGSFNLDKIEVFEVNWDFEDNNGNKNYVFEKNKSGQNVAKTVRAAYEYILASHFGEIIIDELFTRYAQYVGEHLSEEKTKFITFVVLMTKK
ncbi:hypothetical protein F3Y22_tig00111402pilonHSYRG00259 [Hibiscus syriacus]|uniref:Uncharacterized protein n=2 Tax=Hibiscus syriacus TaxID=106335 RepID=A0A6A2XT45_HIBSY|nr:hypothetical protein F3Y22_tig00111402pilonHSYRG00259 [Hibiscus syriacus]